MRLAPFIRPRRTTATLTLAILAIAGCDRAPSAATRPSTARRADAAVPTRVTMTTLATLPAGRTTRLAATAGGEAFALQQADGPTAVVRVADGRPTSLTADAVARSLGVAGGVGQLLAIAARDDDKLAFAFVGIAPLPTTRPGLTASAGSIRLAAIGTWDPATNAIFVGVDQLALADVDRALVDAAALRPTLLVAGADASLWRTLPDGTMRLLSVGGVGTPRPQLAARDVTVASGGDAVERRAWEWSATDDAGRFLLTDTASRWIRAVDARGASVVVSHVARFEDPAVASISPAALDAAGRVIVLARDGSGAVRSLLVQDAGAFRAIDASRFTVDGSPGDASMRVDRLVAIPGQLNAFVAYDSTSGRVVRVELE